jgi:methionine sulfoxide reductase heme-binding subunit
VDWLDRKQVFPLIMAAMVILLIILGSNIVVSLSGDTPAQANMQYWHMERSAGFVAYELLVVTVLLGASSSSAFWDRLRLRRVTVLLHQFSALLIFPFLAMHLIGIHEDTSVPFTWRQIFEPGTSTYKAFTTTLGTISLYVLCLVVLSAILRGRKNGIKVWRAIHFLTYPMFVMTTIHGFFTGTDSTRLWAYVFYLLPMALFVYLVAVRMGQSSRRDIG